ncbi:MAG: signal peptidase II [Bdellovibrionota bacterium]
MNKKYIYLLIISGILISLDQITKLYVHTQFHLGESLVVIRNFFNITYVRNFGAAFGFLANSHPEFREIFFLLMPPVAIVIILLILRSVDENDRWQVTALSCIFGGAIGNYIDRLRFRYVIDFLDFHLQEKYSWPAFNVADSAIVCGVIILVGMMFLEGRKAKNSNPQMIQVKK